MTEEQEFSYDLKIPLDRVAVLIGKDGTTKKEIERLTKISLDITKEGDATLTGKDALLLFSAREIVISIARGFNPLTAFHLLKTDYILEVIDLTDIVGKSKTGLERLRGRIIGREGRSREEIERLTDTSISVYGKTVAIIGEMTKVALARQAVGMLLDGAMHKTIFQFLERKKKEILFGKE